MSVYGYAVGGAIVSAAGIATLITSFISDTNNALIMVSSLVVGCITGAIILRTTKPKV